MCLCAGIVCLKFQTNQIDVDELMPRTTTNQCIAIQIDGVAMKSKTFYNVSLVCFQFVSHSLGMQQSYGSCSTAVGR